MPSAPNPTASRRSRRSGIDACSAAEMTKVVKLARELGIALNVRLDAADPGGT